MAFTTGGLLQRESLLLASLFLRLDDWNAVRKKVLEENALQARKASSAVRLTREIILRLQQLSGPEIRLLVEGSSQDQMGMLWIAICRRFSFIAEFMAEIVRERYLSFRNDLSYADFDGFVEFKSGRHTELQTISESTRSKLRQVLFKMLREVSLLNKNNQITMPTMSSQIASALLSRNPAEIRYFPITENDLRNIAG